MLTQCLVWPGLTPQYINKEKKHLHLIVDCNDCDAATMRFPKAGHQRKKSFPQNQQQDAVRAISSFSRNLSNLLITLHQQQDAIEVTC
ncbi:hypothetical protein BgiMline_002460 [Biomphalaria glabrata]